jgi:hypothetical protein
MGQYDLASAADGFQGWRFFLFPQTPGTLYLYDHFQTPIFGMKTYRNEIQP